MDCCKAKKVLFLLSMHSFNEHDSQAVKTLAQKCDFYR